LIVYETGVYKFEHEYMKLINAITDLSYSDFDKVSITTEIEIDSKESSTDSSIKLDSK
jgi:hypothetical protein